MPHQVSLATSRSELPQNFPREFEPFRAADLTPRSRTDAQFVVFYPAGGARGPVDPGVVEKEVVVLSVILS